MRRWRALGTVIEVVVTDASDLDIAQRCVQDEVDDVDAACSRFRSDSELSEIPCDGTPYPISPLLLDLVGTALRARRLSEGLVDPTVGSAMEALGYDRDFAALRDRESALRAPVGAPGPSAVRLNAKAGTLALAPGTRVDLGATGKARLADRSVEACRAAGVSGVLVSCGGDIAVAGQPPEGAWRVRITDDCEGGPGPVVSIADGGIATSSTTVRRWSAGGIMVHHIVNPRTGLPASGPFRTVSVAAATCVDANIASTAALVLGAGAPSWLGDRGLPARCVRHDGSVLLVGHWPQDEVPQR